MTTPSKEEKKKKHFFRLIQRKFYGICDMDKIISQEEITNDFFELTCNKCKSLLIKDSLKSEFEKGKQAGITQTKKEEIEFLEMLNNIDWRNVVIMDKKMRERLSKLKEDLEKK